MALIFRIVNGNEKSHLSCDLCPCWWDKSISGLQSGRKEEAMFPSTPPQLVALPGTIATHVAFSSETSCSVVVGPSVWPWRGHATGTLSGSCHPNWRGRVEMKKVEGVAGDLPPLWIWPDLHPGGSQEAKRRQALVWGEQTCRVPADDGWRLWFLLITPQRAAAVKSHCYTLLFLAHYFLICCSAFHASSLLVSFSVGNGRKIKEENIFHSLFKKHWR